ncbi:hypothetical protein [Herbiconiux ginsengi]|uniref:Uncharacterized protein n=1 Tax=Herbiconiux ginsengi TaxID=381665 RepID=A0A1H3MNN5_9MICO|nr:hypothetical protein [Herbiconiux ginsengi]SDY78110.1 hypothetical protein SAMN05216554_1497 [Herbiconiux ginsengi]
MSVSDSRTWRLFAPKKPPRLPPKGERWGGLLRPATLVTVGVVGAVVAAVWIGVAVARPSAPTTLEGVTAEVMTEVDTVTGLLGDPVGPADDATDVIPCPDGGAGQQYVVTRTETLPASVSPGDAIDTITAAYEQREWKVSSSPFGTEGGREALVIGKNLVPVELTLAPDDTAVKATIHSESRCTAAG